MYVDGRNLRIAKTNKSQGHYFASIGALQDSRSAECPESRENVKSTRARTYLSRPTVDGWITSLGTLR